MDHVARYDAQARWPPERHAEQAWKRIQPLLDHAWTHVPIWREKFESIGAEPGDIRTWADYAKIPPLTRDDLIDHPERCIADNVPKSDRFLSLSSGSTARRTSIWIDRARDPLHFANVHFNLRWLGFEMGARNGILWTDNARPTGYHSWNKRLKTRLLNQMLFVTNLTDDRIVRLFFRRLSRFDPELLTVFPSVFSVFARQAERLGIPPPRVRAIVSTGETLQDSHRAHFEEWTGAEVFNRYGSIELGDVAHECPAHEGMHINANRVWVEVEQVEGLEKGLGRLLVTDLDNRACPILRYDVGDLGRLWPTESSHACPCGRTLPRLTEALGRHADLVKAPSGRHHCSISFKQALLKTPGIVNAQVVHRPPRELTFRCQVNAKFPADGQQRIAQLANDQTDNEFDIRVDITDDLIRSKSGKMRMIVTL
jgi:phenylacetate-CoA ligase